jgi:hypothetical protein
VRRAWPRCRSCATASGRTRGTVPDRAVPGRRRFPCSAPRCTD